MCVCVCVCIEFSLKTLRARLKLFWANDAEDNTSFSLFYFILFYYFETHNELQAE